MARSKTTQDHDEIRSWAEARGAMPAEVSSTRRSNEPGILRFRLPQAGSRDNESLKEISWDDFFEKFDEENLKLVYREKTAAGRRSNFNKLVHPETKSRSGRSSSSDRSSSSTMHRRAA